MWLPHCLSLQVDYVAKQAGGYYGSASSSVNNIHSEHVQRFHKAKANYSGKLSEQSQVRSRPLAAAVPCFHEQAPGGAQ